MVTRHPNMFARLLQERRGDDGRPTCATAGCTPVTPAIFNDKKGHLVIIDRIKDHRGPPPRGDRFSARMYLENKLKFSPYVAEAVDPRRRTRPAIWRR